MFYIDAPKSYKRKRKKYSHLMTDTTTQELHDFAQECSIHKCWFHRYPYSHYDVVEEKFQHVLFQGAVLTTTREMLQKVRGK